MIDFGKGPTLRESCRWLQNDEERWNRILDAVERNSVVEGLPPFSAETRRQLLEDLQRVSPAFEWKDEGGRLKDESEK